MKMEKIEQFWHDPARVVAPALLGRVLCRRQADGVVTRWMIAETEAYCGPEDRASHAARGETPRTRIMFGPPGFWYVYLCYGVHWMLNLVTGPVGHPAAVLLRGVVEVGALPSDRRANGPGKLTRALGITKALDGRPCAVASGLWIEGASVTPSGWRRKRGPRIGVDYAGPHWAAKPYRWWLEEKRAARG
jgi:DNA-3-methyladenine glycosylase